MALQHASQIIGPRSTIAWLMLVDLAVVAGILLATRPPTPTSAQFGWLIVAGISTTAGSVLVAGAFARGSLSIVQALVSTEGAITAIIAILAGETVGLLVAVAMLLIAVGSVCVAGLSRGTAVHSGSRASLTTVAGAMLAAVLFGVGLYSTGRVSGHVSVWVAALPPAAATVPLVTVPLLLTHTLRFDRRVAGSLLVAGILQPVSFVAFVIGARHSIALTGILAGQSGMVAALAGFLWLSERLTRVQYSGIAMIGLGIAVVSAATG
jgi:drug/metabolite transporter (DMT)-like permease